MFLKGGNTMAEHNHNHDTHNHNYEHCCDNHTPDNHGCGCCGENHFNEHKKQMLASIIISGVFFALGYIISEFTELPSQIYLVCYIISYLAVGFKVMYNAVDSIIHGRIFDENFLMSVVGIGAFAMKEYTEGVAVMFLFCVGEFIQGLAVSRSRRSIDAIFDRKNTNFTLPRHYDNKESRTELLITKFARIYTPLICIIAVAIVVIPPLCMNEEWHEWLHRGLAALVISCPCAIVISVPLAYSAGIGACSSSAVFVKNTDTLDEINNCDTIIRYSDDKSLDDIKVLQNNGHKVIYLGNGENDLTMMEGADIAVTSEDNCTAQSVDLADMVVMGDFDSSLADSKRIAKKVHTIALENIYFSILVKLVILVCDVLLAKELPMWFAIFGDIGVCLLAVANSARIIAMKKR